MTLNTLHIDDIYTVYMFKISFAVMLCLMRQFVK